MNSGGGRSEEKKEHLKRDKKEVHTIFIITTLACIGIGKSGEFGVAGHKRLSEILLYLIFHNIGSYSHTITRLLDVYLCA